MKLSLFLPYGLALFLFLRPEAASAQEVSPRTLWEEATEHVASGEYKQATSTLLELETLFPKSDVSDEVLFLAASLFEEKLAQPAQARRLYSRLIEKHPNSRTALTAKRRLIRLQKQLGPDDRWEKALSDFTSILHHYPDRTPAASLAMAQELLQNYATWPQRYRVQLWMAQHLKKAGHLDQARIQLQEILDDSFPQAAKSEARLFLVDVLLLQGHFEKAEKSISVLRKQAGKANQLQTQELYQRLIKGKFRVLIAKISSILLALTLLLFLLIMYRQKGTLRNMIQVLFPPPMEVLYMLPFVVLFSFMALSGHEEMGPAVMRIGFGGLLIAWLSGNALRGHKTLRWYSALFYGGMASLAGISLCYLSLQQSHFLDLVITTMEMGPE